MLVRTDEEIIDVLKAGQGVLNILPLGSVKDEVDAAIVELYPELAPVAETDPGEDSRAVGT